MNKKELKNKKFKNKNSTKNCSNLISNHQPLISDHKGITLIALVITIIVMLILVGVTVTIALNGGLFTQAKDAARKTQIANIKERVQADIWEKEAENKGGDITAEDFKDILDRYFDEVPETGELEKQLDNPDYSLGTKEEYGPKVEIKVSDLYNGTLAKDDPEPPEELGDSVDTETSYVGYYANLDGDEEPDGIIYADLAVGGEGTWNGNSSSHFSYDKQTGNFKQYVITNKKANAFGGIERDVIKADPDSEGEDRFYVMALKDVDATSLCWYKAANGKLNDLVETSENDFETGKEKTKTMIGKWNGNEYGTGDSNDMWGIIQGKEEYPTDTWFVPSKAEWAAFGWLLFEPVDKNGFGVSKPKYTTFGLKPFYWSSSQYSNGNAYGADFSNVSIGNRSVGNVGFVRLSTTF